MTSEQKVPFLDLVMCLSSVMDLINPALVNHHKRVAYIASNLGSQMGLSTNERNDLLVAGALHDIGALSLKEKMATIQFDFANPQSHAELGYDLLKDFAPFAKIARLVRFHHVDWAEGAGINFKDETVPLGSFILHLADRVSVLIKPEKEILGQVSSIREKIKEQAGKMFEPQIVEAFLELSDKEYFWLDAASQNIDGIFQKRVGQGIGNSLDIGDLLELSNLFSRIIDFRSRFTATHSSGVAATAETLAGLMGFTERECLMMKIAGNLHDLGKLAVSTEILEKPAKLTQEEVFVMRSHPFLTYRTLENVSEFNIINNWGAFHHEKLDGSGYPFHIKGPEIPQGSRIMAVADVFTAVSEDRPYRKSMDSDEIIRLLEEMSDTSLDSNVIDTLKGHFDEINRVRIAAQAASVEKYKNFANDIRIQSSAS